MRIISRSNGDYFKFHNGWIINRNVDVLKKKSEKQKQKQNLSVA